MSDKTLIKFLDEREVCDLECLAIGAFNPLTSYMTKADYDRCLAEMRLADGSVFSIPIVCSLTQGVDMGTTVEMRLLNNDILARLVVSECWRADLSAEFVAVYGCDDDNHPYQKYLREKYAGTDGAWYVSGKLEVVRKVWHSSYEGQRMLPAEAAAAGPWIGFQTRNPLHRSHIEVIKKAATVADRPVLLHPVEGVTQECDIPFPVRMACYKEVLSTTASDDGGSAWHLSILPLSMRMAGPREAVWHAVIRRNYGCSHFIVGRDHAGPSYKRKDGASFYAADAAQKLALAMAADIGIQIVCVEEMVWDGERYDAASAVAVEKRQNISGTELRRRLEVAEEVPVWYSPPGVVKVLRKWYERPRGLCIYCVGLSGAGKTTLAKAVVARIQEAYPWREVTYLDADEIRTHLSKGLGFTAVDRSTNVRRIGYVASEIVRHGGVVVVANIAPYAADRKWNRKLISGYGDYVEVFIDAGVEVCESRDTKGMYKAAREGKLANFTGVSDPFEQPVGSELTLSAASSVAESLEKVWSLVSGKLN